MCSIAECDRPAYSRGRCSKHYNELNRSLNRGTCPCGKQAHSRGLCHACLTAERSHGTCACGKPTRYPSTGECHSCYTRRRYHEAKAGVPATGRRRQKELSYEGAHSRVKRLRGSARAHTCFLCEARPADGWAYNHMGGNDERLVPCRDLGLVPISLNPLQYVPLCKSCHTHLDKLAKRARTEKS